MAFFAPTFMKLLISYQVFLSSLGAKYYPKVTNIFIWNMALLKVKEGKAILLKA
jgi:hypothetical protein